MDSCPRCGSVVENGFCKKCGTSLGASCVPSPHPNSDVAAPIFKRRSTLLWIIGCCLAIGILAGMVVYFTGSLISSRTGLDIVGRERSILQDDSPNSKEIQSEDEGMRDAAENHSVNRPSRMEATEAHLPEWLPIYPGAESTGAFGVHAEDAESGSAAFKTQDSEETVAAFYEKAFIALGFTVERDVTQFPGHGSMIRLIARNEATGQTVHMTAGRAEETTSINLIFISKKGSQLSNPDDFGARDSVMETEAVPIEETPQQSNPNPEQ